MNEKSPTSAARSQNDWKTVLHWFVIVAGGFFALLAIAGLAIAGKGERTGVVFGSFVFSLILTTFGFVVVLFFRWVRQPKTFRRLLFGLACLVTLVALVYAVENWRGKRAWENYRREWEAKGQKFDRKDFIPPVVPDDQNFAMTPFFAPLFDFKPGTQQHSDTNWHQQIDYLQKKVGEVDSKASEQARSSSWVRSQSDLPAWFVAYLHNRAKTNNDLTLTNATPHELAGKVLAALSSADSVLDEIRAASRRPHSRFNIRYENDDPAAIVLPHLSLLKHLTLILQLRTSAELTLGRADDAMNDINLMFHLTDASRTETTLIAQLVRFAQLQIILQPISQGLESHQWSDSQLQVFQQRLQSLDFCADARYAMNAERVFFGGGLMDYMRKLNSRERMRFFDSMGDWSESSSPRSPWPSIYAGVIPTGWYYLEQLNYNQSFQAYLLPIVDVENRRISPGFNQKAKEKLEAPLSPSSAYLGHRVFSAMLLPSLPGIAKKAARAQTAADLAIIACALERFHLANKKYPPTLDTLVPQFLPKLPHDVITGQPHLYRLVGENPFVLYSVGWNEKDDGGTIGWDKDRKIDWDNGDWVWRSPSK